MLGPSSTNPRQSSNHYARTDTDHFGKLVDRLVRELSRSQECFQRRRINE